MINHLADIEDGDDVEFENIGNGENRFDIAELIRNVDEKQFANIRDKVFEVIDEMEVDFEEIMDQDSDEEVLSDDTGFASDASEYDTDLEEKFVSSPEIRALNGRTKHCMIQSYYTTGGMENHERVERELLEQCDQVATLVECFAWLQRCDECIERLEELCCAKRPRLAVGHRQSVVARIARLASAKTQLERLFMHIGDGYASGGYANGNEQSLVWRENISRFEHLNAVLINVYGIENGQFLPLRFTGDKKEKHVLYLQDPCSYDDALSSYQFHRDNDCNTWFARQLENLAHRVKNIICGKLFAPNDRQVRDHCHLIGRHRGPAHSNYNLNYKNSFNIPVVFNNLSGYDAYFIIKEIAVYDGNVDLLPITKEKYISFTKHVDSTKDKNEKNFRKNCVKLRFIDFFKFLSTSLDKLVSSLDKQRYVIHYRNLQQCTRHGLRVTKIHRELQFAQFAWLRDYIKLNTQFRTRAKNDLKKNLYKLMNNAVFGKTMENVRNHVDVKLLTKWDGRYGAEAIIAKPNFHSRSVFEENLIAVELLKLEVKFDKPIYMGMCILDISKVCLYEFHYEYMSPMFQDKCRIMYTDTDSLIYRIECDDAYETMKRDIARHKRLSGGQRVRYASREQKSIRPDKEREQWRINDRICWIQSEDVCGEGGRQEGH
ncbi:hypothetical protein ALC57_02658 [Trachymyrmex cornetzi]|uniref:DNA-directed DNA polymerase n=1 Tax=Trachymyrmex cornetzi TaxID=471704 RepID=A0A151JNR0_9HYME|nr:hypothetical protein ALC57_02658 [Trachymyrmex cornetzi]